MLNPFATCPERLPPARSPVRPARRIGGHRTPAAPTGLPAIAAVCSDRARPSTLPVAPPPVSAQLSTESGAARPAEPTSRPDTRGSSLAGAWYGWLRLWAGSIWPVSLSHSAFNNLMEGVAGGGDSDFAGGDGARDHRDRRNDHDHHGAGCWLPADPQSCRLRQGRVKIPAGDHRSGTAARTAGTEDTR
jgi:hypothetical protein